jgi:hypothetical protein
MILPHDANPGRIRFSERTTEQPYCWLPAIGSILRD